MSYQRLIIVGNLGRDPEMRYMPDGTPVTTLSVATNRKWNNPDGSQGEETTWFRVTLWRKQAEVAAQYLTKGRLVMIEGRLNPDKATGGPRIWTRQDGTAGASYEVTAERLIFLGGRGEAGGAPGAAEASEEYEVEGEIPF
ncbi:MAG: single-stranded DNA-binding protein [Anaerolineae bacterium]